MKPWHFVIYVVVALLGFSIVTVYSTDMATVGSGGNGYQFMKHLLWILVSSLLLMTMSLVDYHYLQKLSIPILVISLILLSLVLLPGIGTVTNGARRWIRFNHILGIQPLNLQSWRLSYLFRVTLQKIIVACLNSSVVS